MLTVYTTWMCCVFAWLDWNCFIPVAHLPLNFILKLKCDLWFDLIWGKMIHDLRMWFEIWFVIWHKDLNLFLKRFVIWHYDLICDLPITARLSSARVIFAVLMLWLYTVTAFMFGCKLASFYHLHVAFVFTVTTYLKNLGILQLLWN